MPRKGTRSSSKRNADDISEITSAEAPADEQQPAQQPAEEPGPLTRIRISSRHVHRLPVSAKSPPSQRPRRGRALGPTGLVVANAFGRLQQMQQMPVVRPAKRPCLTWANLAHACHNSCRDAGSNVVSMLKETVGGAKEVLIAAMADVRAATVAGFRAAPAVAPAMANGVVALCTLSGLLISNPASVAALTGLGATVHAGGIVPLFWSCFGY